MGLLLDKLKQIELGSPTGSADVVVGGGGGGGTTSPDTVRKNNSKPTNSRRRFQTAIKFPDLETMPPELSLQILKYLNATDLCLAACVWASLANDDVLWQSLCKSTWGYASIYNASGAESEANNLIVKRNYRSIFMHLDEATLTFNVDWKKGLEYLFEKNLVQNDSIEIARFINSTKKLNSEQKEKLFKENKPVLENVLKLQNYENQFLPTALRRFFSKIEAPKERNSYLSFLLEQFSSRFCSCNPQLGLSQDAVYILCFSLIILSVDLSSPAVKNKMSKREFIRNTRNALPGISTDFTGHLYDNIYLNGSIASPSSRLNHNLVRVR